jgi:hypothetical protein
VTVAFFEVRRRDPTLRDDSHPFQSVDWTRYDRRSATLSGGATMKLRGHRIPAWMREMRRLRQKHRERLLTLLAILLVLTMFVFAPLQAVGIFVF